MFNFTVLALVVEAWEFLQQETRESNEGLSNSSSTHQLQMQDWPLNLTVTWTENNVWQQQHSWGWLQLWPCSLMSLGLRVGTRPWKPLANSKEQSMEAAISAHTELLRSLTVQEGGGEGEVQRTESETRTRKKKLEWGQGQGVGFKLRLSFVLEVREERTWWFICPKFHFQSDTLETLVKNYKVLSCVFSAQCWKVF